MALHPVGPKGFHIIGFDVLFDENHNPKLLELNANSSLSILQPKDKGGSKDVPLHAGDLDVVTSDLSKMAASSSNEVEISELDQVVKEELITQALQVSNPLSHRLALKQRQLWLESLGDHKQPGYSCPVAQIDEPVPLNDDGEQVYPGVAPIAPRPDRPSRCPALRPLSFDCHEAWAYVTDHLSCYRIWRNYAYSPAGCFAPREGQARKFVGFGRTQFRQMAEASGLIGSTGLWADRATAELFFTRIQQSSESKGSNGKDALDFVNFLNKCALAVGQLILGGAGSCHKPEALEAFVSRVGNTTSAYAIGAQRASIS